MPNLNKVMLMGNLTRDPELRRTPKGTAVTDIGLAINRYFSQDDGQRREETTFVDVTLWGRQAEVVCDYCSKGRPLYVEGRLNLDSWEDKNTGQHRTRLKVVGEMIQLLGSRDGSSNSSGSGSHSQNQQQGGYQAPPQQQAQAYQPPPQPAQPQAYQPPPQEQSQPASQPPQEQPAPQPQSAAPQEQPAPQPQTAAPQEQPTPQPQPTAPPTGSTGPVAPAEEDDDIPF